MEGSYCVKVKRNENQLDVSRIEAVMTWSLAVMKNQCNNLQYGTISGIGIGYATAIVFSAVSHVILDMFFHDAYIFCGNRAVSRVTVNFWQIYYMEPVPGTNRNVLTVLQHCRDMQDPPCRFISWKRLMHCEILVFQDCSEFILVGSFWMVFIGVLIDLYRDALM